MESEGQGYHFNTIMWDVGRMESESLGCNTNKQNIPHVWDVGHMESEGQGYHFNTMMWDVGSTESESLGCNTLYKHGHFGSFLLIHNWVSQRTSSSSQQVSYTTGSAFQDWQIGVAANFHQKYQYIPTRAVEALKRIQ